MSARSRYPSPGTDSSMWWDDRPTEPVVILATSRHKRSVTADEAKPMLAHAWLEWDDAIADLSTAEVVTWRSVTEADLDLGMIGESDPGDWHSEGTGAAWVTVLRCDATRRQPTHGPTTDESGAVRFTVLAAITALAFLAAAAASGVGWLIAAAVATGAPLIHITHRMENQT